MEFKNLVGINDFLTKWPNIVSCINFQLLTNDLLLGDQAEHLAKDLVVNGLINESDCEEVCRKITERLSPQAVGSQAAPLPPSSAVQA
jgi:hypothetical protein